MPICMETKEYKNGGHFGIRCIDEFKNAHNHKTENFFPFSL